MKKSAANKSKSDSSVKVIVRVRPMISIEAGSQNVVTIGQDEKSVTLKLDQYNQIQTKFDKTISGQKTQKEVFVHVQPKIMQVVQGYNLTIFAYGQTGSGKTFTMFGKDWENNFQTLSKIKKKKIQNTPMTDIDSDDHYAGLIPRAAHHLFACLAQHPGKFNVFCSFLQIYNQKIYDLLQDAPKPNPLNIHQSKFQGIFVEGLGEFQVEQYTDCLQLMSRGQKNRLVRQTSMNAKSSRSHTIFQIMLESSQINQKGQFTRARLNLCDLAGSEKINKRQNMEVQHLQELKNINLSLTTLGKVINLLSKGNTKNMSFFRQSKLTRLLQQSLIGSTNTFIIGAISPSSKCQEQTLNTLKFVERAQHIKLTIKPTTMNNQGNEIVQKLQLQMDQLRKIIQEKQNERMKQNQIFSKQVEEKLSSLAKQNEHLKNEAQHKKYSIQQLMEENRRMKQALVRMERVALDNFSEDLSLSQYSDQEEMKRKQEEKKKNKKIILADIKKSQLPNLDMKAPLQKKSNSIPTRNQIQQRPQRTLIPRQYPKSPPQQHISPRKSDYIIPNGLKKKSQDQTGDKRRIISRLENLQQIQRSQQLSLMRDLDVIHEEQRHKSQRINRSLRMENGSGRQSFHVKPRKKIDYSDRIKQLQSKLKNR